MRPNACVVLPTYNEAENVRVLVPQIFDEARRIETHDLHVLVVDDASPDGTAEVVRGMMDRFPRLHLVTGEKRGLGEAYKRGMAAAVEELDPDLVLQMDADLQHPPALVPLFVALSTYGFSLVIGSRFAPGGSTPEFSLRRRLLSLFGNWLIRFLGGLPRLHDCTSGFRCIKAEILRRCDLSFLATRGYSFQSSLLFELLRNGARPVEVPMVFRPRAHGQSKLALRDQLEFLLNVGRLRFRRSQEFLRFLAVGLAGVFVNMALYLALTRLAGLRMEAASPIAIEASILSNFALHSAWTFRDRPAGRLPARLGRFHLVALLAAAVNYGVLLGLVRWLGMHDALANLLGIGAGTLVNYAANSAWTWRRAAPTGEPPAAARGPRRPLLVAHAGGRAK